MPRARAQQAAPLRQHSHPTSRVWTRAGAQACRGRETRGLKARATVGNAFFNVLLADGFAVSVRCRTNEAAGALDGEVRQSGEEPQSI